MAANMSRIPAERAQPRNADRVARQEQDAVADVDRCSPLAERARRAEMLDHQDGGNKDGKSLQEIPLRSLKTRGHAAGPEVIISGPDHVAIANLRPEGK